MIETSQFLYQLWRDFSYWFCRIDKLADFAIQQILIMMQIWKKEKKME